MKYKFLDYMFSRVSRNIAFWLLFTLFHYSGKGALWYLYPVQLFVLLVSYAGPCYINNLVLLPRFLMRRKYIFYFGSFTVLLAVTMVISYYVTRWSNRLFPALNYMDSLKDVTLVYHVFPSMLMLLVFAAAKFTTDAFHNQRKLEALENQRLKSELESLKSQINPHFLFNSLNTIYGLAKRTDHDTADAVMKLSDILRYILYDCNADFVALEKEIAFLRYFIDFAKLRSSNARINLEIKADVQNQQIIPLVLLPFIENAIKHGLGKHMQNSWIDIKVSLTGKQFYFECSNSNHNKNKFRNNASSNGGIGLKNVSRRLNLLYGDRHTLEINDNEKFFMTRLNIELQ